MTASLCCVAGLSGLMGETGLTGETGCGWASIAGLAVCSFSVGFLAGALYKSATDAPEYKEKAKVSCRRHLGRLQLRCDPTADATIPIPNGWSRHDPNTAEGRRHIADLIVNHDATGRAKQMLETMFDAASAKENHSSFMTQLQLPLSDPHLEDMSHVLLWGKIVPAVWSALPKTLL